MAAYNDVILDINVWEANLPNTISAVFYPETEECAGDPFCQEYAHTVQADLLAAYSLNVRELPLLKFRRLNWTFPFASAAIYPHILCYFLSTYV